MSNKLPLSLIFVLCFFVSAFGQESAVSSVVHNQHKLRSSVLGEERSILVRLPPNYSKGSEKFPVIYMLDGHGSYLSLMPGIIENQSWGKQMPEMILVSIQNTVRTRDLTPTIDSNKKYLSGGGDKFLQFIEKEVIPLVEKNYRTQPYRIFVGHSLGGLTVVYTFLTKPDLFNGYIAASPYLHWDNNFPLRIAENSFKQKKVWNKTMFLALGNEPDYVNAFNSFKNLLDRTKPQNFDYEFQQYPDEIHTSIVLRAYHAGLRKIYAGWMPPPLNSVAELENYYQNLSAKYGYEIKIPDDALTRMGSVLLREKKLKQAIEFYKRSLELFPNTLNTYGILAQIYEMDGQLQQAKNTFEKGYKTAEERGETQLAAFLKSDFERLSAKLKQVKINN